MGLNVTCLQECVYMRGLKGCVYVRGLEGFVYVTSLGRCVLVTGLERFVYVTDHIIRVGYRMVHIFTVFSRFSRRFIFCLYLSLLMKAVNYVKAYREVFFAVRQDNMGRKVPIDALKRGNVDVWAKPD